MSLPAAIRLRKRGKHEIKTYLVKIVEQLQSALLMGRFLGKRKKRVASGVYSGYDWQLSIKFKSDLSFYWVL